ncbi:MAG: TIGR03087 family PEP-CTERM/XrtA system glycosyltransferase [Pseudomonadota bacterium]|nr:TIGR03087 family PEP-CTERM/XrtA system glycosyltransferase [Pseudomonadota bacterium]
MKHLLLLIHRLPFPPNKGDKLRSYHLLKFLSQEYCIHLGTFVDTEEDWQYVDEVKKFCYDSFFARLDGRKAQINSLRGFITGQALTLPYYFDRGLQDWVNQKLTLVTLKHALVFSSAMAQYLPRASSMTRVADLVDVDSDKWAQYAKSKSWPLSWVYTREARRLLTFERQVARDFNATVLVNEREAALFRSLAPESADRVTHANNGVDTDYFSPKHALDNPYPANVLALAFTGAMDYWPNVDAAEWFVHEVFIKLRSESPQASFYIVGARPCARVKKLADFPGVVVTGSVPDIRPYLAHARLAVAPLRIARGTQNKVLEAMAMGKIVIASPEAAQGIAAEADQEIIVAKTGTEFLKQVSAHLSGLQNEIVGNRARSRVMKDYSWQANLGHIGRLLQPASDAPFNGQGEDSTHIRAHILSFPARKSA